MGNIFTHEMRLLADPSRVVVRPFHLAWHEKSGNPSRSAQLIRRVLELDEETVESELAKVLRDFDKRHWQTRQVFRIRFQEINARIGLDPAELSENVQLLIGAYFCHEYSYAAAALTNPSIVPHPDQSGMDEGSLRFLMSARAVGEGHISSVAFREGIVTADREIRLLPLPPFATAANQVDMGSDLDDPDASIAVHRNPDSTISGTVIFPVTDAQANGIEDLRLTKFIHDDGRQEYIGTYTAYSGQTIRSELLRTENFTRFDLMPMRGDAASNKGMGLFPRTIDGKYQMIGRQDGKNLYLLQSDDLECWNGGALLLEPHYPWEFVQIGNCGPPIEIDEGWLLLTHGVGAMRKYSIGAILLDRKNPMKVIGRTARPILSAAEDDREGYVPNVVYTCGAVRNGDQIFIPYGVADSSVAFGFISIPDLLGKM
ncbi:MAG: glycosidase [Sphingopyxis sp.]|nr:MAG: glycosidase [Sphingopyxis sp.]